MFFDPVELGQASFGKAPKGFNAVDMSPALGKMYCFSRKWKIG
jgi:hypothetical protein